MRMVAVIYVFLVGYCAICATVPKELDIRPETSADKSLTAVEWQKVQNRALAAATAPDELKKSVASSDAADELLVQVSGAYQTDPVIAAKIAAVTQFVMKPGTPVLQRRIWSKALLRRAVSTEDSYVAAFCLEQLRWCGDRTDVDGVRKLAACAKDYGISGFADMVVTELEGCPK